MQNLPITITATPPASPANQTVSRDSNAAQASEPFSNVLARQHASKSTPNTGARDSKQATPSSGSNASPASSKEQSAGLQAPAADTAGTLPDSLIPVGLLLVSSDTDSDAGSEKTDPLAPAPDAAAALPGDILAALLPASTNSATTNEKNTTHKTAPGETGVLAEDIAATLISTPAVAQEKSAGMRPQAAADAASAIAAGAAGTADVVAASARAAAGAAGQLLQSPNPRDATSLSRKQGNPGPAAMAAPSAQAGTFTAALETMGKEGAKAAQLAASAAEFSAQTAPSETAANLAIPTQNGTAPIAASPNGPAQATISTPVAHNAWGDELGQKITWLATQHAQSAELHLNPPQLGPLDVVLKISGDQATMLFSSQHAAVRDAVEQALPRLREMLADNGIMLGNATVSDQTPKEQQSWLAGQQQNRNETLSEKTGGTTATDGILSGNTALPIRRQQGMVDTFA